MRSRFAAALVAVCAACGGSNKPAPVSNVVTGEPTAASATVAESPGDARVIQRTQSGGTIELVGNRNDAMTVADKEMAAHCGPGQFTITQEGEEVIGDADANPPQIAWRLYYSCTGAVPP